MMQDEPKPHVNPDLTVLNASARATAEAVKQEQAEIQARAGLRDHGPRRMVKPLTPPKAS